MTTVDDIMTREVETLDPGMTLRDASEFLSAHEVSGAPVTSGGKVLGIVSLTDLVEFHGTVPGVPVQREDQGERGDWADAEVYGEIETGRLDESGGLDESDEAAVYFHDFWVDAGANVAERMNRPEGPEWDVLEDHAVSEVMTRQVVAVPPGSDVREAARLMASRRIHRILVMGKDGELAGILSTMDLVRALGDGRI